MNHFLGWLKSRLSQRTDSEHGQALTRMAITEPNGRLREIGRGHHLLQQLPHLSGAA